MKVKKKTRKEILDAITELGATGATITEIEKKVSYERHTLSKYLIMMKQDGLLDYRPIGKAKLWHINTAPLRTIFKTPEKNMTFTEKVLNDIVSNIPQGVIVMNAQYQIQYANKYIKNIYGDIEGKIFYKDFLGHENPLQLANIRDIIDGSKERAEVRTVTKDDSILNIKASKLTNPDNTTSIIMIIEDVTESEKRSHIIKRQAQRNQALADITKKLVEVGLDVEKVLNTVASQITLTLGDLCIIRLPNENGILVPYAIHHKDEQARQMIRSAIRDEQRSDTFSIKVPDFPKKEWPYASEFATKVITTGKPLFIPVITQEDILDRKDNEYVKKYDLRSTIVAPIKVQGKTIGTIGVDRSTEKEPFTLDDLSFLENIAGRASLAIENSKLHENVHKELHARQELQENLEKTQSIINNVMQHAPVGILAHNTQGEMLFMNNHARNIVGEPTADLLSQFKTEDAHVNINVDEGKKKLRLRSQQHERFVIHVFEDITKK